MKKKLKIFIPIILFLLLIIIIVIINNNNKVATSNGTKKEIVTANTNENIIKNETYNGLRFTNIALVNYNGMYTFTANVENITNETIDSKDLDLIFYDKNNEEIAKLIIWIPEPILAHSITEVTASSRANLSLAIKKKITESKQ